MTGACIVALLAGVAVLSGFAPTGLVGTASAAGPAAGTDPRTVGASATLPPGAAGESDLRVEPAYVFPPDDRQRISPTTSFPWSAVVKLYLYKGDLSAECSGAMVGEFHVLTAGHCVYWWDDAAVGWVDSIRVVPGADAGTAPFGEAWSTYMRTYAGWISSADPGEDWAVVTLDRRLGRSTGWFNVTTAAADDPIYEDTVNTAGYPGDLDYGQDMYFTSDLGCGADANEHYFWLDTYQGQSGSPVWTFDGTNRSVVSIVTYETASGFTCNEGTRINAAKYDSLLAWLAADGDRPAPVDTTAPVTHVTLSGVQGEEGWYRSVVTASLETQDAGGMTTTYYRLDPGSGYWLTYAGPFLIDSEGSHFLEFFSEDQTGNQELAHGEIVSIDLTPPEVLGFLEPEEGVLIHEDRVDVSWQAVDFVSGIQTVTIRLDNRSPVPADGTTTWHAYGLSDGSHTLRLEVTDRAGNVREASVSFRVDASPFSATGPYGVTVDILVVLGIVGLIVSFVLLQRRASKRSAPTLVPPGPAPVPPAQPLPYALQCGGCGAGLFAGQRYCRVCGRPTFPPRNEVGRPPGPSGP